MAVKIFPGFNVADGQTAVTSGIGILCRQHPHKQNCVIVFLDTEGLHDPYKVHPIESS